MLFSLNHITAAESEEERIEKSYQRFFEFDSKFDRTEDTYNSFYNNGTYKVGCSYATVGVYDQNDAKLGEFHDLRFCSSGIFLPDTNIFINMSDVDKKMAIYDLDKMELIKMVDTYGLGGLYMGFQFTPDGKYLYRVEELSEEKTILTVYDTENFNVEKVIFEDDPKINPFYLELFDDQCYVYGYIRGDSPSIFAAEIIDEKLCNMIYLDPKEGRELEHYKNWEICGFSHDYYYFWVHKQYEDITILKSIRDYVEGRNSLLVQVNPLIPEVLKCVDTVEFVTDAKGCEYASQVMFTSPETITDLKYSSFRMDFTEDGDMILLDKTELFNKEEMLPGEVLVTELEFLEFMPNHCLEFIDSTGKPHCYLLSESGMDGRPILSEYHN